MLNEPHPQVRLISYPFCAQVDGNQQILWPIANNTRKPTALMVGTYLTNLSVVENSAQNIHIDTAKELHKELLPDLTQLSIGETETYVTETGLEPSVYGSITKD